jgi:glycerol-1-phosphate dehydrogenase [NAD(P)+]
LNAAQETIARGLKVSRSIAAVELSAGALSRAPALLATHFGSRAARLVADENTWAAAGAQLEAHLAAAGIAVESRVLPAKPKPKPSVELAAELMGFLASGDAVPVAVGSGVVNDVVKYAAFRLGRPYLCVATAASMDGYTSAGAPLSEKGFKKTIQCRPARAIIGDLDVLCQAPREMSAWGYSDLAGKIPAGADWILADALGIEAIDSVAWPMVQEHLRAFLSQPEDVAHGAGQAIENLFAGLAVVGFAMEAHGSSRPASGADHQIAHLWEMQGLEHGGSAVSHGSCVAIGSLAVLRLYDWFLRQDIGCLDIDAAMGGALSFPQKVDGIRQAFGSSEIAERAIDEVRAKHADADILRRRLNRLTSCWPELRARLERQVMTPGDFAGKLKAAGAPSIPADIGISNDRLRRTVLDSRFLRSRYTILDVLEDTGLLHRAVDELFPGQEDLRRVS